MEATKRGRPRASRKPSSWSKKRWAARYGYYVKETTHEMTTHEAPEEEEEEDEEVEVPADNEEGNGGMEEVEAPMEDDEDETLGTVAILRWACDVCQRSFATAHGHHIHEHACKLKPPTGFKCTPCDITFPTLTALNGHRGKKHPNAHPKAPPVRREGFIPHELARLASHMEDASPHVEDGPGPSEPVMVADKAARKKLPGPLLNAIEEFIDAYGDWLITQLASRRMDPNPADNTMGKYTGDARRVLKYVASPNTADLQMALNDADITDVIGACCMTAHAGQAQLNALGHLEKLLEFADCDHHTTSALEAAKACATRTKRNQNKIRVGRQQFSNVAPMFKQIHGNASGSMGGNPTKEANELEPVRAASATLEERIATQAGVHETLLYDLTAREEQLHPMNDRGHTASFMHVLSEAHLAQRPMVYANLRQPSP